MKIFDNLDPFASDAIKFINQQSQFMDVVDWECHSHIINLLTGHFGVSISFTVEAALRTGETEFKINNETKYRRDRLASSSLAATIDFIEMR